MIYKNLNPVLFHFKDVGGGITNFQDQVIPIWQLIKIAIFNGWKVGTYPLDNIETRHINGDSTNYDGNLFLNYNQNENDVYFGSNGYNINCATGFYNGSCRYAYDGIPAPDWNACDVFKNMGRTLSYDDINNANYPYGYIASKNGLTNIGLPIDWGHILNFRHRDNNGFNAQLVLTLNPGTVPSMYFRSSNGLTWTSWYKVNATAI